MEAAIIRKGDLIEAGSNAARDDLIELEIPGDVIEIGDHAFEGCLNLKKVVINEGVIKIGELAFANCPELKSISLPSSLTEIGDYLCRDCPKLKKIIFAGTYKQLKKAANKIYSLNYPTNRTITCSDIGYKASVPASFKKKIKAEYGD